MNGAMRLSMPAGPAMPPVTVAVCTFRRAQGLQRTLQGLWAQQGLGDIALTVLVVDNDAQASGRAVVDSFPPPSRWAIRYVVEPRPGVASARNRCLAEARTDLIAFIDDDEVPAPGWLAALLRCRASTQADAVFGSVVPRFDEPPPAWSASGALFTKGRHPTGSVIGWEATYTANVLLTKRVLQLAGGAFDERFAASGGEDTQLFWRAERAGAKLVWCDEAVVHEHLPAARLRLAWLLRRAFKGGQNWVRIRAQASSGVWLPLALRGLLSVLVFALLIPPTVVVSRRAAVRHAVRVAGGLGKMSAWWAGRPAAGAARRHYAG
ncbi:MAG: glycosyltransferase family 2 protein [Pseudomonadota bacterium]